MNRTSGDSKEFDVVCMSFGKENQKGIEVIEAGEKDSFLEQTMEIKAESSRVLENGNLETQNGNIIIDFANYKQINENRKNRLTERALANRKNKQNEEMAL